MKGSNRRSWHIIIWVFFSFSFLSFGHGSNRYNSDSLDTFVHDYAQKALAKHHTGILYNVSLPANFSDMEVSAVGLRSASFWARGANFTAFIQIPPRIIPIPFVKRLAIIYQNLGSLSSDYYRVPGYTLVAPVVGFMIFNASDLSAIGDKRLELTIEGDPISVLFPNVTVPKEVEKNVTLKCVEFGLGGSVEMSDMTRPNLCSSQGQGHFSIVVPTPPPLPPSPSPSPSPSPKKKERLWKWWVVGFVGGFVGLVLVGLVGIGIYKLVSKKKMKDMEKESEKSVAFDSIWIGRSKMPSATAIRTQPVLETEYVP